MRARRMAAVAAADAEAVPMTVDELLKKAELDMQLKRRQMAVRTAKIAGCGTRAPTQQEVEDLFLRRDARERAGKDLIPTADRPRLRVAVHYHVLYHKNVEGSNVPLERIQWAHQQLNRDFTMTNGDLSQVPTSGNYAFADQTGCPNVEFLPLPADHLQLQVQVSRVDVSDALLLFPFRRMNALSPPRVGHLNIYIVPAGPGGVTGIAINQGIMCWVDHRTLGSEEHPTLLDRSVGRGTLTHEVAHTFGLFHTFDSTCSRSLYSDLPRTKHSNWFSELYFDEDRQQWDGRGCNHDSDLNLTLSRHPSAQVTGPRPWSCGNYEMFMNYMDYGRYTRMFTVLQANDIYDWVSTHSYLYEPAAAFSPDPATIPTDPLGTVVALRHYQPYKLIDIQTGRELRTNTEASAAVDDTSWVTSGQGSTFFLTGVAGENTGRQIQGGETVIIRDHRLNYTMYHNFTTDRTFFRSKTFLPILPLTLESADSGDGAGAGLDTNSILRLRTFTDNKFVWLQSRNSVIPTVRGTATFYCRFVQSLEPLNPTTIVIPEPPEPDETGVPTPPLSPDDAVVSSLPLRYDQPYLIFNHKTQLELSSQDGQDMTWVAEGNGTLWYTSILGTLGQPLNNGDIAFLHDDKTRRQVGSWKSTLFYVPPPNGLVWYVESDSVPPGSPLTLGHSLRLRAFNGEGYLRRKLTNLQNRATIADSSVESNANDYDLEFRLSPQTLPPPPTPVIGLPATNISFNESYRLVQRSTGREVSFGEGMGVRWNPPLQGRALTFTADGGSDQIMQGDVVFITDPSSGQHLGGSSDGMFFVPPVGMVFFLEGERSGAPLTSTTPIRLRAFGSDEIYVNSSSEIDGDSLLADLVVLGGNRGFDYRLATVAEPIAPEVPGLPIDYDQSFLLIENDSRLEMTDAGGQGVHLTAPNRGQAVYLRAQSSTGPVPSGGAVWISLSLNGYQLARDPALINTTTAPPPTMRFTLPGRGTVFIVEADPEQSALTAGDDLNTNALLRFRQVFTTDTFLNINASKRFVLNSNPDYRFRLVPNLKQVAVPELLKEGEVPSGRTSSGSKSAALSAGVITSIIVITFIVMLALYIAYKRYRRRRSSTTTTK